MDIIFNIIDNINPNTMIIITVVFAEKYSVSIGKDDSSITLYFYDSDKREVIKFYGSHSKGNKYLQMKKYIQEQIDNYPMNSISGFSNVENKEYLNKFFIITPNQLSNEIIDINKSF